MKWPDIYTYYPNLGQSIDGLVIRPIHDDDKEKIRIWRNNQMRVLRQKNMLTEMEQDDYFTEIISKSMESENPDQILLSIDEENNLVAYGGLVHISWEDQRAELSFLTCDTLSDVHYERYFTSFINYLVSVAQNQLGLHKIFTETYSFRLQHIAILEKCGLKKEGELMDHVQISGSFHNSIIHGVILV